MQLRPLLAGRVVSGFAAVVLEADGDKAMIALDDPAVRARCDGDLTGGNGSMSVCTADVDRGEVRFAAA